MSTKPTAPVTPVIVTISWAKNADDEQSLEHSLRQLTRIGLRVVIADRGNSPSFTRMLQRLPNVHLTTASAGLVPQVQAAMALAAELRPSAVLYTEPDKAFFFQHRLGTFIDACARTQTSTLFLAARSVSSFETYPSMQRYTESVFNQICGDVLGVAGDFSYGPFLLPAALLSSVQALPADVSWGWRPATFRAATAHRVALHHIIDDLPCPDDQRTEDAGERRHRIRQLSENLRGLLLDDGAFSSLTIGR
jgi:hypothetical protein